MIHGCRVTAIAALCLMLGPAAAMAQGTSIGGRVADQQSAAVVGATVMATASGQPTRTVQTGADGSFTIDGLAPATYTIRAEAPGFDQFVRTVTVAAVPVTMNVTLQVAGLVADVTVSGTLLGTAATGKTTLPARDLPLTIQGVPKEIIAEQGANDLVTALRNVPGTYSFTSYGVYEYYTFRGFFDSVQLLDGVRNEGNRINTQLTNIERVEVLKGPSSALYGGGALGATVNLIRKKPSAIPTYEFMGAAGNWSTGRGAFGATGRLGSDAALYRLDIGGETRKGYRTDDARRFTVTPSLSSRLSPNDQLNVYYTFNRDHFGGDAGLPLVAPGEGPADDQGVLNVPHDRNYRTPYDDATSYDHNLQVVYARQFNNALGFRNALSYRHFNDQYFLAEEIYFTPPSTVDRYALYFYHHRRPLMNIAELTARTTRGLAQDLVFGWETQRYYNHTDLPREDWFQVDSIDAFNPVDTQGPSDLTPVRSNIFLQHNNAFYVQDNVELGAKLRALVGGRFDIYRRMSRSDDISGSQPVEGPETHRDASAFTGRAGLVYQPTPNVDVYGSFANSFKPLTLAQPDGTTLEPETGTQWEVGQRLRMLRDRMQLNLAVYRIKRQNVAFRRSGNVYVQAGEMQSRGFEADLTTSIAANWRLNASYGYTNAEFLDYEPTPGVNLRGNKANFVPPHTFSLWAGYEWANGFGVNAGTQFFSSVFADQANRFSFDSYGLLNFAVRYRRGPIELALNVNNATDTEYYVPHLDFPQAYPGAPVNMLGTVRVRLQ